MLLAARHLAKRFASTVVLADVSFVVNEGDRLALVGPNGAGKSTLLRLLAGQLSPDAGDVVVPRSLDIGYLPQSASASPGQEPGAQSGQTIDQFLHASQGRLHQVMERLRVVEAALERSTPVTPRALGAREAPAPVPEITSDHERLLLEYADLVDEYDRLGGYGLAHRIEEVFAGLGIGHLGRDRKAATLSGGEKARVALAALLLRDRDLLLLDEPTNHLDGAALAWLETFLRAQRRAFVVASHDRQFLNRTATALVELDEYLKDARVFAGSYDTYAATKAAERARWREAYEREQAEIKALREAIAGAARGVGHANRPPPDNDKYARTFFGENVQRAVSRNVRAAQEQLRRIEADPLLRPPDPLRLEAGLDPGALAGHQPLLATSLRKSYGGRPVLDGVDLTLRPGDRIVVTGPNGAGKTTLLRLLAGREEPDGGAVRWAPAARIGYLDQEQESLDPRLGVFNAYRRGLVGDEDSLRAALFRHGFFHDEDVRKRVGELSVGQRRKLQLARLAAEGANVLLLDEPTNHLDLPTLEAFEAALADFPGPILAVSHDRWFIGRFAGDVYALSHGRLNRVHGPPPNTPPGAHDRWAPGARQGRSQGEGRGS